MTVVASCTDICSRSHKWSTRESSHNATTIIMRWAFLSVHICNVSMMWVSVCCIDLIVLGMISAVISATTLHTVTDATSLQWVTLPHYSEWCYHHTTVSDATTTLQWVMLPHYSELCYYTTVSDATTLQWAMLPHLDPYAAWTNYCYLYCTCMCFN